MWTESKTNDQFSSTGWIVKLSQIFCLRKDTCSKPKPRQNCIGQLDRAWSAVTCHTNDVIQDSLRNTRWATQYLSDVWLSTKKVTTYKRGEHEQSTDGGETTTVGGETSRGRNVLVAKRLGDETSRWRNVRGRNVLWRGETSINL